MIMTELTDEEFERLWNGIDHRKGGQGDSPYTQEFVDELFGNREKARYGERSHSTPRLGYRNCIL